MNMAHLESLDTSRIGTWKTPPAQRPGQSISPACFSSSCRVPALPSWQSAGCAFVIGLGALAAATVGINGPATGFHRDAIRIPMMAIAVIGSLINLYVLWRIHSLRARPASRWRVQPATPKQKRSERIQSALAYLTLALVATEGITHHIIHHGH